MRTRAFLRCFNTYYANRVAIYSATGFRHELVDVAPTRLAMPGYVEVMWMGDTTSCDSLLVDLLSPTTKGLKCVAVSASDLVFGTPEQTVNQTGDEPTASPAPDAAPSPSTPFDGELHSVHVGWRTEKHAEGEFTRAFARSGTMQGTGLSRTTAAACALALKELAERVEATDFVCPWCNSALITQGQALPGAMCQSCRNFETFLKDNIGARRELLARWAIGHCAERQVDFERYLAPAKSSSTYEGGFLRREYKYAPDDVISACAKALRPFGVGVILEELFLSRDSA